MANYNRFYGYCYLKVTLRFHLQKSDLKLSIALSFWEALRICKQAFKDIALMCIKIKLKYRQNKNLCFKANQLKAVKL